MVNYSRAGSDNGNSREREFPGTLGNSRGPIFTPGERDLGKQAKPASYSGRGRRVGIRVLYYGQDLAKQMTQAHVLRSQGTLVRAVPLEMLTSLYLGSGRLP